MDAETRHCLLSFEEFLRGQHWTIGERLIAQTEEPHPVYLYYVTRFKENGELEEASYWVRIDLRGKAPWTYERIPPRPPFHMPSKYVAPWDGRTQNLKRFVSGRR